MKGFALILIAGILIPLQSAQAGARAEALFEVVAAVVDAGQDLPAGPQWRFPQQRKFMRSQCEKVAYEEVESIIEEGVAAFTSYYVDEELPFDEAFEELQGLSAEKFYLCRGNVLVLAHIFSVELSL